MIMIGEKIEGITQDNIKRIAGQKNYTAGYTDFNLFGIHTSSQDYAERLIRLLHRVGVVCQDKTKTILLTGETGSGTRRLAEEIHNTWFHLRFMDNADESSFIPVNCAIYRENQDLARIKIFGAARGSIHGSPYSSEEGAFSEAFTGTLFLDKFETLSSDLQEMLAEAIETYRHQTIGGVEDDKIKCRIILATDKNIHKMVKTREIIRCLYDTIRSSEFEVLSLKDRIQDIPILIEDKLEEYNRQRGQAERIDFQSPEAKESLIRAAQKRNWPGNYKQLSKFLEEIFIDASRTQNRRITQEIVDHKFSLLRRQEDENGEPSSIPAEELNDKTGAPIDFKEDLKSISSIFGDGQEIEGIINEYGGANELKKIFEIISDDKEKLMEHFKDNAIALAEKEGETRTYEQIWNDAIKKSVIGCIKLNMLEDLYTVLKAYKDWGVRKKKNKNGEIESLNRALIEHLNPITIYSQAYIIRKINDGKKDILQESLYNVTRKSRSIEVISSHIPSLKIPK